MVNHKGVPDPTAKPTMTVVEAGALLGLSRSASYHAATTGAIPHSARREASVRPYLQVSRDARFRQRVDIRALVAGRH